MKWVRGEVEELRPDSPLWDAVKNERESCERRKLTLVKFKPSFVQLECLWSHRATTIIRYDEFPRETPGTVRISIEMEISSPAYFFGMVTTRLKELGARLPTKKDVSWMLFKDRER